MNWGYLTAQVDPKGQFVYAIVSNTFVSRVDGYSFKVSGGSFTAVPGNPGSKK